MNKYSHIFRKREFATIHGKRYFNLVILFVVFVLSIGSLSFSRAGLKYLSYKMEDPFINWIDVSSVPKLMDFYIALADSSLMHKYSYSTVEQNIFVLEYVFNSSKKKLRVEGRTIDNNSVLLEKILSSENVLVKRDEPVMQSDYGWIVTEDLMIRLGYEEQNDYPLFINFTFSGDSLGITSLGVNHFNNYQEIPIPIFAVVKQLPGAIDFITTPFFKAQLDDYSFPFNLSIHPEYFDRIQFVVDELGMEDLRHKLDDKLQTIDLDYEWENPVDFALAFQDARLLSVIVYDSVFPKPILNELCREFVNENRGVYRFYDYKFGNGVTSKPDYVSIMFIDLGKIKEFQQWAKNDMEIRIDMTQIEAKDNFKMFQLLAWLLSFTLIVISLFFISIFLYFLINAHFQKISKNLGTIMAFGLDNKSIINIYLAVFMRLVFVSLCAAYIVLLLIQIVMEQTDLVRENGLPYLDSMDGIVIGVTFGVLIMSVMVVYKIISDKLKSTPGDLIYERSN